MKLAATYQTEVFITTSGSLCIAQEQMRDDGETTSVVLSREQARLVAAEIACLDAEDGQWTPAG